MANSSSESARAFECHRHEVYAWAYRLLGRHHDALDVAQDVFLRWTRQAGVAVPDHPRSWLRRVTMNRAIDVIRARVPSAAQREPAVTDAPSGLELDELRTAITAALADLTDQQRSVLTAKVHEGLTFREIADEHELAVPTVKTHYLRAVRAVRDRLAPRWQPEARTEQEA